MLHNYSIILKTYLIGHNRNGEYLHNYNTNTESNVDDISVVIRDFFSSAANLSIQNDSIDVVRDNMDNNDVNAS